MPECFQTHAELKGNAVLSGGRGRGSHYHHILLADADADANATAAPTRVRVCLPRLLGSIPAAVDDGVRNGSAIATLGLLLIDVLNVLLMRSRRASGTDAGSGSSYIIYPSPGIKKKHNGIFLKTTF